MRLGKSPSAPWRRVRHSRRACPITDQPADKAKAAMMAATIKSGQALPVPNTPAAASITAREGLHNTRRNAS